MGPVPVVTAPLQYPSGQRHWITALERQDWVQDIRIDGRENLLAICRELMLPMVWETLESMPGWDRLREATGLSDTTIGRWLLELRLRGWLVVVETGSTPQTRPMVMATGDGDWRVNGPDEGNRRAVYGLRIPLSPAEAAVWVAQRIVDQAAVDIETERAGEQPPAASPVEKKGRPSGSLALQENRYQRGFARERGIARETQPVDRVGRGGKGGTSALRAPGFDEEQREIWRSRVPTSGFEQLVAAAWLRRHVTILGRLSRRGTRWLCRPLWAAGWSNLDIVHALDHQPGAFDVRAGMPVGRALPERADSRDVWRWVQARLRAWIASDGRVLPGFHQVQARRVAARRDVVERHGRAGGDVLGDQDLVLTADHVARFGRRVAATLRTDDGRPRTFAPGSDADVRAAAKAELDQAMAEREAVRAFEERRAREEAARRAATRTSVIEEARARRAARTEPEPAVPVDPVAAAEWSALTPEERVARLRAKGPGGRRTSPLRSRRRRRS
jgi:hypothetical protein